MLTFTLVASLAWWSMCAAEPAPLPTLDAIIEQVSKATYPDKAYEVPIHQKIVKREGNDGPPKTIAEEDFLLVWTPAKGMEVKDLPESSDAKAKQKPAQSVRIRVEPLRLLKKMKSRPGDVAIASGDLDGRPCYVITTQPGKEEKVKFVNTYWVDVERGYVPKVIAGLDGRPVLTTTFEQRRVNDAYWMPGRATIENSNDNSTVTLDYGTYAIKAEDRPPEAAKEGKPPEAAEKDAPK